MTPAEVRERARVNREQAKALRVDAAERIRLAGILERQADELDVEAGLLTNTDTERTIRTMDVNTQGRSASVKRGAGRATRKHPAQKKLYEKGKTITDIAADLGEGRPRVSSWFADGDANRPIPRRHAEKLFAKYGIPLSAWSRVAD